MKNSIIKYHKLIVITVMIVLIAAIAIPIGIRIANKPNPGITADDSSEPSKETVVSSDNSVSSNPLISSQQTFSSEPASCNEAQQGSGAVSSKKPSSSKPASSSHNNTSSQKLTGQYLDNVKNTSVLTGTQADVGKVVGFSTLLNKEITVVSVTEGYNGLGLKYIETSYSDMTATCIAECAYCRKMPCPDGGGESCSQYSIALDSSKTCQTCGKPCGNGYYGTCCGTIDWDNGGKVSCNHYSNCLKCGRPVGDGHNGTCHVTWGKRSGETTCNHYD